MAEKKYLPPKCEFEVVGNHIVSKGDIRNKVSGTSMAGILNLSPWSSPFQVACALLGLCREDISKKPAVKVGVALESKIIKYAGETYSDIGMFLPAEEVYEKREGDHDAWVSDFQDDYFAGHVDGIVMTKDGEDYILEVKTTGNPENWEEEVPEYYYWQVALYNEFISKKDKAYVVLGIVNQNTYKDPESWVPNENTVGLFMMSIVREQVQARMQDVREWYDTYIANGITPDYDPNNKADVEMFEHLKALVADVDEMQELLDEYAEADAKVAEAMAEVKEYEETRDNAKSKLKEYMASRGLSSLDSKSGACYGVLSIQTRKSYDYKAMAADGIDIEKYATVTETKTFSVKPRRNE